MKNSQITKYILFLLFNLFITFSIIAQTKPISIHYKDKDYTVGHDIVSFI
jgi:hypothetical protein